MLRLVLITLVLLLLSSTQSSCAVNIGNQELRIRPGRRVPARAVPQGDGDLEYWEEWIPSGDAMFVFVRGQF